MVQIVNRFDSGQEVVSNFAGVEILTPSFADEFLRLLRERYQDQGVRLENIDSAVVRETFEAVERIDT